MYQNEKCTHPLTPAFLHVEINPEEIIQQVEKDICAKIFMAVFFMVVQSWKYKLVGK